MTTVEEDLQYFKIALDHLEAYLLSPLPQWPLEKKDPGSRLPAPLTVENLLLTRQRLSGRSATPLQAAELEGLETGFQSFLKRWRANVEKKASQGFRHRLNLWAQFIADLNDDRRAHTDRYPQEVRLRAMLTLLVPYVGQPSPGEINQLDTCDQRLRAIFVAGKFIWPVDLQASFPATPFWYLYGSLTNARPAAYDHRS